jgi:hypothetical protein
MAAEKGRLQTIVLGSPSGMALIEATGPKSGRRVVAGLGF